MYCSHFAICKLWFRVMELSAVCDVKKGKQLQLVTYRRYVISIYALVQYKCSTHTLNKSTSRCKKTDHNHHFWLWFNTERCLFLKAQQQILDSLKSLLASWLLHFGLATCVTKNKSLATFSRFCCRCKYIRLWGVLNHFVNPKLGLQFWKIGIIYP